MDRNCGVIFKKNEGWRAELTICNGDRFYTSYFKEYLRVRDNCLPALPAP